MKMVVLNIDLDTWCTLRNIDDSIKFMYNNNNDNGYDLPLKKHKELKKYFIREIYDNVCN